MMVQSLQQEEITILAIPGFKAGTILHMKTTFCFIPKRVGKPEKVAGFRKKSTYFIHFYKMYKHVHLAIHRNNKHFR